MKTRIEWPEEIKTRARMLRKDGLTFSELSKKMNISRSTLHLWVSDLKSPTYITDEDKRNHLKRIRKLANAKIRQERIDRLGLITKRVKNEIDSYTNVNKDHLKSILSALYWAEGSKTRGHLDFANTDPKLAYLFITLLRKCYKVDEEKIRARLHLHYYHSIKRSRTYWSKLLKIPEAKFGKIYIKKRSKTKHFRKNFAGICFIRYYSEDLRFEILEYARLLAEKLAPVA